MGNIFNWLFRNLSNIFGLAGIVLTIYFGAIYAPSWIKENQNEKLNVSKRQTIQSIKELIFSDSTVTVSEIKAIVVAKELDEKVTIPFTFYEILTLCQLSFMEDKFLPLTKRKELIKEIESLKTGLLPEQIQAEEDIKKAQIEKNSTGITSILLGLLSTLAGIAGVISFYFKFKSDTERQEEIINEIEQSSTDILHRDFAIQTEKEFTTILSELLDVDFTIPDRDEGYDMYFNKNDKSYYIEFKFLTKSKVGLGSFKQFLNSVKGKQGEAWFIYNTNLTPLVIKEAKEFSVNNNEITLRLINATDKNELVDKVKELLHTTPR